MGNYLYFRHELEGGPAELWLPKGLSADEVKDFADWAELLLRRQRRKVQSENIKDAEIVDPTKE